MLLKRNSVALVCLFLMIAGSVYATTDTIDNRPPKEKWHSLTEEQKARIETLKNRVEQIKAMDKSKLSKADRKELRKELKQINREVKEIRGKTFVLALGGIIIVILLLILLL